MGLMSECFACEALENKIGKLTDDVKFLTNEICILERQVEDHKKVADQLHHESVELQNLKAKMRLNISKKIETDYFMLKDGNLPILWVNAWNKDLFPASSFVQMADRIKRVNPDIDLIILTYGVDSIQQMDDKDLAKIGLYRDLDAPSLVILKEENTALMVTHESTS